MPLIRRVPMARMYVFNDLFSAAWNNIKNLRTFKITGIVFDSYTENGIKEGEQKQKSKIEPLEYVNIRPNTKVSNYLEWF